MKSGTPVKSQSQSLGKWKESMKSICWRGVYVVFCFFSCGNTVGMFCCLSELTVLVSQSFVSLGCWRVDGSQGSRKHHHLTQATNSHSELQIGIQSATDRTEKCSSDEGCGSDAPQTLVAISCSFIISSMVKNNRPTPDLPSTC